MSYIVRKLTTLSGANWTTEAEAIDALLSHKVKYDIPFMFSSTSFINEYTELVGNDTWFSESEWETEQGYLDYIAEFPADPNPFTLEGWSTSITDSRPS